MKNFILGLTALSVLAACSEAKIETPSVKAGVDAVSDIVQKKSASVKADAYEYVAMEGFNPEMGDFIGLVVGDSLATAEMKINAVFKAYDGHSDPLDIGMDKKTVEADWQQLLVTQDGLLDGTVTGQQLLAVFDEEDKLVSYGLRIKCHTGTGTTDWQKTVCE